MKNHLIIPAALVFGALFWVNTSHAAIVGGFEFHSDGDTAPTDTSTGFNLSGDDSVVVNPTYPSGIFTDSSFSTSGDPVSTYSGFVTMGGMTSLSTDPVVLDDTIQDYLSYGGGSFEATEFSRTAQSVTISGIFSDAALGIQNDSATMLVAWFSVDPASYEGAFTVNGPVGVVPEAAGYGKCAGLSLLCLSGLVILRRKLSCAA